MVKTRPLTGDLSRITGTPATGRLWLAAHQPRLATEPKQWVVTQPDEVVLDPDGTVPTGWLVPVSNQPDLAGELLLEVLFHPEEGNPDRWLFRVPDGDDPVDLADLEVVDG